MKLKIISFPIFLAFLCKSLTFNLKGRTLTNYLSNLQPNIACEETISAVLAFAEASIEISNKVKTYNIDKSFDYLNSDTVLNPSGELQKTFDLFCDDIIRERLRNSKTSKGLPSVCLYVSEELKEPIIFDDKGIAVFCDPLDGSSNLDFSIATGTIFTIAQVNRNHLDDIDLFFNNKPIRNSILAAGYFMYSSSTEFLLSFGGSTNCFSLNPNNNEYILTYSDVKCPSRGPYYSLNEARSGDWPDGLIRYDVNC